LHHGELVVTGREKEIIFVNGQNYYPHDLEQVTLEIEGMELGKVAVAGFRKNNEDVDTILVFVLHKGNLERLVTTAKTIKMQLAKELSIEVDEVVPVPRMPKTTSGKIQRYLLVESYLKKDFDEALLSLKKLLEEPETEDFAEGLEQQLLEIAREFITDKPLTTEDNIFEIGTSSLTLAQIHERIEEKFPGQLDITDFFEYPTIREIAEFLSSKDSSQPA
jgi:acyl carrier protein